MSMNEQVSKDFTFRGSKMTVACRVCGAELKGSTQVSGGKNEYETNWKQCESCQSWSIDRVPEPKLLDIFYTEYNKHLKLSSINADVNDGVRFTEAYLQTRRNDYLLGINDVGFAPTPGSRVVDFGAQDGVFLDLLRELYPEIGQTIAVDYATSSTEELRRKGHEFIGIDEWLKNGPAADFVSLWDVYEHIADLDGFLASIGQRITPGGQLLIQTPMASLHANILGPLWHHFLPVQHLQLPSRDGLVDQFKNAGFSLIKAISFGANASPSVIPQPYKRLFDAMAKTADLGATQVVLFRKNHS
jgi:SAM-dependent methyltransferase